MGLDAAHDAHGELGLMRQCADRGCDGTRGDARKNTEQRPAVEASGAQPLRNREHDLAVRHAGGEEGFFQPQRPERETLGVAAAAEVARLAGEGEHAAETLGRS